MRTVLLALLLLTAPARAADPQPADKPIPTRDAAKAMTVPDGFKVTLFAGEPDVVQPIAFTFDDRGRMWVVECLSYPIWSKDGKGKDRVVILEDTDGDGVHDKKTVFLDNGSNLSGIELGFGGVWLCSSPNLLFVPILEGDKPGKPEVKLDGWNMIDTKHNIFNSLVWGPDGWLYGCNGIQAKAWVGAPGTPKDKRTYIDCGVWRYHPTEKRFEAFAHGTTNPFGLDFNDHGELFITNCVIDHLFHFAPGAHYERMYGQDANPHTYGLLKSCVDYRHWAGGDWTSSRGTGVGGKPEHSDAGGGHAHSGAAIYLADNFPAEYRNTLFTANIHGNRLNNDGLARTASGYKGVRRKDFLFANDAWFRGICVKTGPEGGLYVSDWCDTGECHNYDKADTTNGRIYRVVYKNANPLKTDISKLPDAELVKLQLSPNDWLVRKARRVLQERAAAGKLEKTTPDALRKILKDETDTARRLRGLWALEAIAVLKEGELIGLLSDRDETVRAWAYRLGAQCRTGSDAIAHTMSARIAGERSPFVLAAAASALQYFDLKLVWKPAESLIAHRTVRDDSTLSFLLWYGVEQWYSRNPESALTSLLIMENPLIRRNTVRLLLARPDANEHLVGLVKVIATTASDAVQLDVLRGIRESLAGKKSPAAPNGWPEAYTHVRKFSANEAKHEAEAVAVLFGDKDAIATLLKRVTDTSAKPDERRAAVELLAPRKLPDFAKTLQALLSDADLRGAAIRTLASFADTGTPAALIRAYPKLTPEEKADAVQTLAARVGFAKELLDAIEKGTIPRTDVPVVTARQVLALNDKALSERLEKVWGKITPVAKERAVLMKKWKDVLTEDTVKKADVANGRALFTKNCASCHKMFGEGQAVGPELTGSQRSNLEYVLENVLDPSAVVPNEYRMVNFSLADDRVVSGIVLRETKDAVTVRTVNDTLTVPVADIVTRKQTALSIMPEGLFDAMKPDEVRDLIAYLRAKEQVPIPKK
ncbi:membrane-bound dehydrogenase domain protein : Putative membrane-bound dehydrogenase OS=Singulisphaera acidiphila (strain ATCC BAA-1392 / DSM 18658 / VKM B-2454 / MOB10) GN=Sinac_5736 PE=4 SV=1: Cytochrom_C [Gemmata massiliana]|uniref:Cytochrome c domain-containing protein n=1 Tax=Gemmata massiliana TaxID=1210884 RepID=A0A6P2DAD5_9BACT|nr:PVC-type heme-binding CxxCH protein [Gemmata massiliana]VTR97526.1 membrane-bound dehydrogenase domain protein : Putative membrane-bound dehydrogenase OS=Singulisphaera acidiphila (strain ATCC BAA-1392 / DSM 18658 / VKM B-2454 / MOB10) GN=Sinac_5736 PE=4 SV=1: Cytochrom_C [Gemmata massiliana]